MPLTSVMSMEIYSSSSIPSLSGENGRGLSAIAVSGGEISRRYSDISTLGALPFL